MSFYTLLDEIDILIKQKLSENNFNIKAYDLIEGWNYENNENLDIFSVLNSYKYFKRGITSLEPECDICKKRRPDPIILVYGENLEKLYSMRKYDESAWKVRCCWDNEKCIKQARVISRQRKSKKKAADK